jgi:hypothetical protein
MFLNQLRLKVKSKSTTNRHINSITHLHTEKYIFIFDYKLCFLSQLLYAQIVLLLSSRLKRNWI